MHGSDGSESKSSPSPTSYALRPSAPLSLPSSAPLLVFQPLRSLQVAAQAGEAGT